MEEGLHSVIPFVFEIPLYVGAECPFVSSINEIPNVPLLMMGRVGRLWLQEVRCSLKRTNR